MIADRVGFMLWRYLGVFFLFSFSIILRPFLLVKGNQGNGHRLFNAFNEKSVRVKEHLT